MAELILHHYDISPYAEKIRLAFGLKGLAWASVIVPATLPKPDLMPLTGGFRRTPVLQIGADIYCDTLRIAMELDRRCPEPPLLPESGAESGSRPRTSRATRWKASSSTPPGKRSPYGATTPKSAACTSTSRASATR